MSVLRRVRGFLKRFGGARTGAIAPLFAIIATFALMPAVAVSVDVARSMSGRNNLQDALDAAALAVAHLPANSTQATITATAQSWLNANVRDGNLAPVVLTVTMGTQQVTLNATSSVKTTLGALGSFGGMGTVAVSAHSVVKWGLNHIELALVLDNTGSMADDNKLSSLQSAAGSLVDTLSASATQSGDPNALKIGVVPFSDSVNVGVQYQTAAWMTGTQPSAYGADIFTTATNRFALLTAMRTTWGGCVEDRPMPYDVQDTAPIATNGATLFVPMFAPDEPDDTFAYGGQTYQTYDNNYLTDSATGSTWQSKQGNPVKYISTPRTGTGSWSGQAIGPNYGCGTASVQRLTTSISTVKTKLNQMVANGNTHIPLGMAWGWHVLSPNAPFADGAAYGTANTIKIVVLVTDGQNTYSTGTNNKVCVNGSSAYYCATTDNSFYSGLGYVWQNRISTNGGDYTNPASALNDRLAQVCTNMKAQNIIIYTVPVEVTDTGIKSLLQTCASSAANYIDVASSSQLQAAFTNIAGSISAIRIAQ